MAHGTAPRPIPPINPKDFTDAAGRLLSALLRGGKKGGSK
jgi:hypothetical protein